MFINIHCGKKFKQKDKQRDLLICDLLIYDLLIYKSTVDEVNYD